MIRRYVRGENPLIGQRPECWDCKALIELEGEDVAGAKRIDQHDGDYWLFSWCCPVCKTLNTTAMQGDDYGRRLAPIGPPRPTVVAPLPGDE